MNPNKTIWIAGANVWNEGKFSETNIAIRNGKITESGGTLPESESPDTQIIRADGKYLVPGLVDMHVHFREPGYSYKETIATGSRAAAKGGFTTVCTMPNLNPAPDSIENLQKQLDIIRKDAAVNVLPNATINQKRMGTNLWTITPSPRWWRDSPMTAPECKTKT